MVVWQRPLSWRPKFGMQKKQLNSPYPIRKNMLNSCLMENPTFTPWCGKKTPYSQLDHRWSREFGNLKHPRWNMVLSVGCYQFSTWTMVLSLSIYLHILHWNFHACGNNSQNLACLKFLLDHIFFPNMLGCTGNSGWGLHLEVVEVCLQGCFSHHLTSGSNVITTRWAPILLMVQKSG